MSRLDREKKRVRARVKARVKEHLKKREAAGGYVLPLPARLSRPADPLPPRPAEDEPPVTDPKPVPVRGFDAMAEAVLADVPVTETAAGAARLSGSLARINADVRAGRLDTAARLVERTIAEAAGALGQGHPDVLRLRELAAYITYLAGDPVRACRLSLELARRRHQAGYAEAAYGNIQSAAAAWRAVREPGQALGLGRDLITLWTDVAAEEGPAADDIAQLNAAHMRMIRLAARALRAARP